MNEFYILYETKTENYFVGWKEETITIPISCWRKDTTEHIERLNEVIENMKIVKPNSTFEIK